MPLPGETSTLDLPVDAPGNLPAGSYSIHLELPDGSPRIADDPRYSVQLANSGTWRPARGTNDLALDVTVGGEAPVDPVDPDPVAPTLPPVTTPPTTPPVTTPPTASPVTAPPTPAAATGVVVVDAVSDDRVARLSADGSTVVDVSAVGSGQFSAVFDGAVLDGGSVAFELSGPIDAGRVEDVAPYTLFGDASGELDGRGVVPGPYSLKVTVYAGGSGQGAIVSDTEVAFTIT